MTESFFGKLKTEMVHHRAFATHAEARCEAIKCIEGFYNRRGFTLGCDIAHPQKCWRDGSQDRYLFLLE
ncbi:IS3 family transposase [Nonomuraea sp. H19]|uniref:IS3 family transposase n=1 Tax=Nonomuraea sp. H19 TaxID=3452206 RepID=UPI003F8CBF75